MSSPIIDLEQARARRQPAESTIIVQVAHVRTDAEVHRQIGINDALTFEEFHEVLGTCFALPDEDAPWHFFEHDAARGARIDPTHRVRDFLRRPGQHIDYVWGLWDFTITVAEVYLRDADTPRALCVGGSGSFDVPFDITAINAQLTGATTINAVLEQVRPEVRDAVVRSRLFDFVPLLQALDLTREVSLPTATLHALASLPREVTLEGRDAFWSTALALTCMGDKQLTESVLTTTLEALGWVDDSGAPLLADAALNLCADSLAVLTQVRATGPEALAPVDRLDLFRALLRR